MTESKTIFLVRHAESTNNVSKRLAKDALKCGRLPTAAEWQLIRPMFGFPMDSELSDAGRAQAAGQRSLLDQNDFVRREHIEVVLHSPLTRASETANALFDGADMVSGEPLALELCAEIYEKNLSEHAGWSSMATRCRAFEQLLRQRPERILCVVGHSAFFRGLGCVGHVENTSVWKATLKEDGTWDGAATLVFRDWQEPAS